MYTFKILYLLLQESIFGLPYTVGNAFLSSTQWGGFNSNMRSSMAHESGSNLHFSWEILTI